MDEHQSIFPTKDYISFTAMNPDALAWKKARNGACAHYVMVSKFQWKPFWLATQRDPQNDWTATQIGVNYDVFAQAPLSICILTAGSCTDWSHQCSAGSVASQTQEYIPSLDAQHLWDKCESTMPCQSAEITMVMSFILHSGREEPVVFNLFSAKECSNLSFYDNSGRHMALEGIHPVTPRGDPNLGQWDL